ncbi:MAG TPA: hypothetical protein VHX52_13315 [Steroidobacteraceae bacterium]|nr:hypothetical protein [Steroidobacteraceae bacterium]
MKIELDTEVRRLLFEQVTSYEQLEALLLLHGRPAQGWSVAAVAVALRIDAASAASALDELVSQRLAAPQTGPLGPEFHYAAGQSGAGDSVDRLAQAYSEQRLEVVKQMSANAIDRVRSSAARTFSDAFIFRRKKDDR